MTIWHLVVRVVALQVIFFQRVKFTWISSTACWYPPWFIKFSTSEGVVKKNRRTNNRKLTEMAFIHQMAADTERFSLGMRVSDTEDWKPHRLQESLPVNVVRSRGISDLPVVSVEFTSNGRGHRVVSSFARDFEVIKDPMKGYGTLTTVALNGGFPKCQTLTWQPLHHFQRSQSKYQGSLERPWPFPCLPMLCISILPLCSTQWHPPVHENIQLCNWFWVNWWGILTLLHPQQVQQHCPHGIGTNVGLSPVCL